LDTDDTELDAEEDSYPPLPLGEGWGEVESESTTPSPCPLPNGEGFDHRQHCISQVSGDPFAEKFEEEEVVLDNFAAWDDMFRHEAPRVENRRDPGFSNLVQAAIEASPVAASKFAVSENALEETMPVSISPSRPRLRLADVPDNSSADSPPSSAAPSSSPAIHCQSLAGVLSAFAIENDADQVAVAEPPVVVIEDDNAKNSPTPPVRREDYRNLFSRLRSG
jgi:hypothetical protein